jgi:hypothetical protein
VGHQPDLNPAQAASAAALAMRRNPPATLADVGQPVERRALALLTRLQPRLAGRYAEVALLARRRQDTTRPRPGQGAARLCGWHLARALAGRLALPAPRYTADHRALLGEPCSTACRAQVLPKPKPAPRRPTRPRATAARAGAGLSRGPRTGTPATPTIPPEVRGRPWTRATVASYVAADVPGGLPTPAVAAYNTAALARLGLDPTRHRHLTSSR